MLLSCLVEVLRVQTYDCEGEDELQETQDKVDEIGDREERTAPISQTHLAVSKCVIASDLWAMIMFRTVRQDDVELRARLRGGLCGRTARKERITVVIRL